MSLGRFQGPFAFPLRTALMTCAGEIGSSAPSISLPSASFVTAMPARIAAGFSTRFRKFAGRIGTFFWLDGNSQAAGFGSMVSR